VLGQLERMLKSPPFRHTKRCQDLLRHLVLRALAGDLDQLKERLIGVEVFGRDPTYDTNQDPVVRGAAMELRKRLAQYYLEAGENEIRLDVSPGSYIPEFHWPLDPSVPDSAARPAVHRRTTAWKLLAAGSLVVAVASLFLLISSSTSPSALDEFWAPVLAGPRPVLLCIGLEPSYHVSTWLRSSLRNHPAGRNLLISPRDIEIIPPALVPLGDAISLSRFTALFSKKGKSYQIRGVSGTSFADLRDFPTVLIGAYSNEWTTQLNARFRFSFSPAGTKATIEDRMDPKGGWRIDYEGPEWNVPEDYAIASRILDPSTGNVVVTAAGLLPCGTQAAGELLTDAKYLEQATRLAPRNWQHKNLQIVLRTKVVTNTAGPPEILATHVW
jgi:hypothetical protein